jgi:hypothetical protein
LFGVLAKASWQGNDEGVYDDRGDQQYKDAQ